MSKYMIYLTKNDGLRASVISGRDDPHIEKITSLPNFAKTLDFVDSEQQPLEPLELEIGHTSCPIADKLDRLTEAIEQGYMIAEDSKTPFKISCIEREIGGCLD